MRKCWDFWHRMRKVPESIRYNAFFNVYDKLLPTLAHTMWPAGQEFDFAHKEMPRKRGPNGMLKQYRELTWRVRRVAKSGWLSESWLHMEKVMVQSVMTYGKLNATLGRISPWKCVSVVARQCIFGLIGHMAGFLAPAGGRGYCSWWLRDTRRELVLDDDGRPGFLAGPPFKVAIGSLAAIGCGSLWRKTRTNRHMKRHRDEFDGSDQKRRRHWLQCICRRVGFSGGKLRSAGTTGLVPCFLISTVAARRSKKSSGLAAL